jgi:hypothetical protein
MDVPWSYKLKPHQSDNPIIAVRQLTLPHAIIVPTDEMLKKVFGVDEFKPRQSRLKTWGRAVDANGKTILQNDPHWIAVRNGTPLHYDPKYPRYSHHLKVRVDEGTFVRGLKKLELNLMRGTFYIFDTHSPHQVVAPEGAWNVSISIDCDSVWDVDKAIAECIAFGLSASFEAQ